ncbi:MAG: SRPBCC domain-containing protein [bacterium]|nr:SRPBCC domain-containing protein [bacterium]
MEAKKNNRLSVQTSIKAPIEKVWELWTNPEHIVKWNFASIDWHAPKANNELKKGGRFVFTMAAKDGSMSFDFSGIYTEVLKHKMIAYTMDDGRTARVLFASEGITTQITEQFDAETENTHELQVLGWQAILTNFRAYAESQNLSVIIGRKHLHLN